MEGTVDKLELMVNKITSYNYLLFPITIIISRSGRKYHIENNYVKLLGENREYILLTRLFLHY
jgi:hypothetical protein